MTTFQANWWQAGKSQVNIKQMAKLQQQMHEKPTKKKKYRNIGSNTGYWCFSCMAVLLQENKILMLISNYVALPKQFKSACYFFVENNFQPK